MVISKDHMVGLLKNRLITTSKTTTSMSAIINHENILPVHSLMPSIMLINFFNSAFSKEELSFFSPVHHFRPWFATEISGIDSYGAIRISSRKKLLSGRILTLFTVILKFFQVRKINVPTIIIWGLNITPLRHVFHEFKH